MAPRVKRKGSPRIEWKRPVWDFSEDGTAATMEGTGVYDEMLAQVPLVRSTHPKLKGLKILRVHLEPGRANDGKIILTFSGPPRTAGNADPNIYERDWGTESRPIERHPKAPKLNPARPFYEYPDRAYHAKNNKRYNTAAAAKDQPVAQRTFDHWSVLDEQDIQGGAWSLAQYKTLKEAGWSDYEHTFPVGRSTIYSTDPPAPASGILNIENPPGSCGLPGSGWLYFKSADRSSREGSRFRHSKEWEGRRGSDAALHALVYG